MGTFQRILRNQFIEFAGFQIVFRFESGAAAENLLGNLEGDCRAFVVVMLCFGTSCGCPEFEAVLEILLEADGG